MSSPEKDTAETVEKLLNERRKVNGWLRSLAARRGDTSPAVYQRVFEDYTAKLDKVQGKLVAASDAVQVATASVAERLSDKEAAVATKCDERAEAELRAAVGEFSEREWDKRRTKLDDEVAAATGERDAMREELARLRAVLAEVADTGGPPDAALADGMIADVSGPPESSAPTPVVAVESVVAVEPVAPAPPAIPIYEQSIDAPAAPTEPATPLSPSFDELAFLKAVVGRPSPIATRRSPETAPAETALAETAPAGPASPAIADDEAGTPAPSEAIDYSTPATASPPPFPDPVPEPRISQEMTPPRESFFRSPTPRTSEAAKSLRCQECGTFNFATEWYCERCGGELAAM